MATQVKLVKALREVLSTSELTKIETMLQMMEDNWDVEREYYKD